jgi:hypothetical protein
MAAATFPCAASAAVAPEAAPLWYDKPAKRWLQALPVGNTRLGAMVFGDPARERLHLTESTLWSGAPSTRRGGSAEMLLQSQGPELHLPSAGHEGRCVVCAPAEVLQFLCTGAKAGWHSLCLELMATEVIVRYKSGVARVQLPAGKVRVAPEMFEGRSSRGEA